MQSTVRLASPELPELPELPESGNCQELPEIVGGGVRAARKHSDLSNYYMQPRISSKAAKSQI